MTDNKNDNLEDLFSKATSSGKSSSEVQKAMNKSNSKNKYVPYIIGLFSVALLGTGAFFVIKGDVFGSGGNGNGGNDSSIVAKKDKNDKGKDKLEKEDPKMIEGWEPIEGEERITDDMSDEEKQKILEKNDTLYGKERSTAVNLEPWQRSLYSEQDQGALGNNLINYSQGTTITNVTSQFGSADNGYTDDTNKVLNPDGTINEKYSYQTKENIERDFALYTQRLINPVFGGWNFASWGNGPEVFIGGIRSDQFEDMFTKTWWTNNVLNGSFKSIPIYGDWNGDGWGLGEDAYDLNTLTPWQGQVTEVVAFTDPMPDGKGMSISTESVVEFTTILSDGTTKVRKGTLKLKLIPNLERVGAERRNLIDEASLVVTQ